MKLRIGNLLICLVAFIHFVYSANNIITTIAGSGTTQSFSGDNGQATAATLNLPTGCAFDSSGNHM